MRPVVNVSLHGANIADIPAEIHKHHFWAFFELCDQHVDYCSIYTDSFKVDERVASAIVYKGTTKSVRLPDLTSIFWAKLHTFFLTIDVIRRSKLEKFVIFSDSLSTLQAIHGFNIDNDLVQKFIKEYSVQTKHGKTTALWWIPSHVGISGNEKAESAAKNVLLLSVPALKSTASELLPVSSGTLNSSIPYLNYYQQLNRYLKNGKNHGTTVLATNFSQLIPLLVFISTSDRYHIVML